MHTGKSAWTLVSFALPMPVASLMHLLVAHRCMANDVFLLSERVHTPGCKLLPRLSKLLPITKADNITTEQSLCG